MTYQSQCSQITRLLHDQRNLLQFSFVLPETGDMRILLASGPKSLHVLVLELLPIYALETLHGEFHNLSIHLIKRRDTERIAALARAALARHLEFGRVDKNFAIVGGPQTMALWLTLLPKSFDDTDPKTTRRDEIPPSRVTRRSRLSGEGTWRSCPPCTLLRRPVPTDFRKQGLTTPAKTPIQCSPATSSYESNETRQVESLHYTDAQTEPRTQTQPQKGSSLLGIHEYKGTRMNSSLAWN